MSGKADVAAIKTALKVLSKHLAAEAERCTELAQAEAAAKVTANQGVVDELMPRKLDDGGTAIWNANERALGRKALKLLARNTKAASGTLIGIGQDAWAEECKTIAAHIEDGILPMLEEQPSLAGSAAAGVEE